MNTLTRACGVAEGRAAAAPCRALNTHRCCLVAADVVIATIQTIIGYRHRYNYDCYYRCHYCWVLLLLRAVVI